MARRLLYLLGIGAVLGALAPPLDAANHREAPITALDHKADITDVYAFMGYGPGSAGKVTIIMGVDPLLDTANGPNWFPFDDEILYELKIDHDHDAREDISFQFRFDFEQRLPGLFQVYAGVGSGAVAPPNSPPPVAPSREPALTIPVRAGSSGGAKRSAAFGTRSLSRTLSTTISAVAVMPGVLATSRKRGAFGSGDGSCETAWQVPQTLCA